MYLIPNKISISIAIFNSLFFNSVLNHFSRVEFPTLINWTKCLLIRATYKHTVETLITLHVL